MHVAVPPGVAHVPSPEHVTAAHGFMPASPPPPLALVLALAPLVLVVLLAVVVLLPVWAPAPLACDVVPCPPMPPVPTVSPWDPLESTCRHASLSIL